VIRFHKKKNILILIILLLLIGLGVTGYLYRTEKIKSSNPAWLIEENTQKIIDNVSSPTLNLRGERSETRRWRYPESCGAILGKWKHEPKPMYVTDCCIM